VLLAVVVPPCRGSGFSASFHSVRARAPHGIKIAAKGSPDFSQTSKSLGACPVSDVDQRAAGTSVGCTSLMSNQRAGREMALKNKRSQADTEEPRQAKIHYRSLIEDLQGKALAVAENKLR